MDDRQDLKSALWDMNQCPEILSLVAKHRNLKTFGLEGWMNIAVELNNLLLILLFWTWSYVE